MKHTAIINLDAPGTKINRHIYGHFAEHLGHCIYGGFYVGEESSIPNKNGLRLDVIEAFRNLNIPNLRWPGGCFADEYHWMDGIGPKESRPEMVNTHWGGVVENNHFGTHEFLELCELLGTEPYICGNVGSGTVQEMSQWVEYLTFGGKSPMADLRRENGREEPWKIKLWGIGNENWGCGGGMTAEYYADQARRYATYCRNYGDNKLYKVAGGPDSGDFHWMETLMKSLVYCSRGRPEDRFVKGISLHYYTVAGTWQKKGKACEADTDKWMATMKKARHADTLISVHKSIMDRYDPKKKIGLVFDEWGNWHDIEEGTNPGFLYQQNTIRDTVSTALHLDIFHKHADRLRIANLAQAVNVLQAPVHTSGDKMFLTPTYHVLEMNKGHMDADNLPLFTDFSSHTAETDGEQIDMLSMSASRNSEAGSFLVSVTNLDPEKEKTVSIDLRGGDVKNIRARILTSSSINDHNTFEKPGNVAPKDFTDHKLAGSTLKFTIPAHSFLTFSFSGS